MKEKKKGGTALIIFVIHEYEVYFILLMVR